jgi:hypothetical protein
MSIFGERFPVKDEGNQKVIFIKAFYLIRAASSSSGIPKIRYVNHKSCGLAWKGRSSFQIFCLPSLTGNGIKGMGDSNPLHPELKILNI